MKKTLIVAAALLIALLILTACGSKSAKDVALKELGLDVSKGKEISNFDTHSGNGDGISCVVMSFADNTVLEKIKGNSAWKAFPLDKTVQTLVYGVSEEKGRAGPYLIDKEKALMLEIQNGFYLLVDRQKETGSDILQRASLNFTLGLYDTDANTLYFCRMDT